LRKELPKACEKPLNQFIFFFFVLWLWQTQSRNTIETTLHPLLLLFRERRIRSLRLHVVKGGRKRHEVFGRHCHKRFFCATTYIL
jgi:hypothetical protein